eukprot:1546155-Pyramimonas_sp.AAC.1
MFSGSGDNICAFVFLHCTPVAASDYHCELRALYGGGMRWLPRLLPTSRTNEAPARDFVWVQAPKCRQTCVLYECGGDDDDGDEDEEEDDDGDDDEDDAGDNDVSGVSKRGGG